MGERARPEDYKPAAGVDWLLPLYDPVLGLFFPEQRLRGALLEQAALGPGLRLLDVGCGTGSFAVLAKRAHPEAAVTGLDGDPGALAIARRKAARAGAEVRFVEAFAFALPYADRSLDRVVSSLVFHHLSLDDKRRSLAEIRRVLAPAGVLLIQDFGPPTTAWGRLLARLARNAPLRESLDGRLVPLLREAGFGEVEAVGHLATLGGTIWCHRARPGPGGGVGFD